MPGGGGGGAHPGGGGGIDIVVAFDAKSSWVCVIGISRFRYCVDTSILKGRQFRGESTESAKTATFLCAET